MNHDLKYVLLPTIQNRRRTPKFQPWTNNNSKYRERLRMKYPCRMDTKNWKFVKDGLDDFRDGLPPPHDDIMIEPDKGPGPIVLPSQPRRIKATVCDVRDRLTDHQIYFSRELPSAEKRRLLIDSYISALLDHPLAFFTHFNQALTPELYDRLTKVLESELLRVIAEDPNSIPEEFKENTSVSASDPLTRPETGVTEKTPSEMQSDPSNNLPLMEPSSVTKSTSTRPGRSNIVYDEEGNQWDSGELDRKQKNPYRWFIEKQREKQNAKGPTQDEEATTAMEARLRSVAEQFCTWLHDLSAEGHAEIDPAVVRNLFSTAYDTKPSLSSPIKIVEMTRIPAEIREGVKESMVAGSEQRKSILAESHVTSSIAKFNKLPTLPIEQGGQSPRKYRYGAWYLPKHLWRRSLTTEELRDPAEIKAELEDETRKREERMNARLAPLHGINAFKEYLVEKNIPRLPKLITDVEQYRVDHPRDETNAPVQLPAKQAS